MQAICGGFDFRNLHHIQMYSSKTKDDVTFVHDEMLGVWEIHKVNSKKETLFLTLNGLWKPKRELTNPSQFWFQSLDAVYQALQWEFLLEGAL